MIVAVVDDLFFSTKIKETAISLDKELKLAKNEKELLEILKERDDIEVIAVDLCSKQIRALDVIEDLKSDTNLKKIRVIGYCHHTMADLIEEAKSMGIEAMPRSLFSKKLPKLLA